jgi:hypothetical protein
MVFMPQADYIALLIMLISAVYVISTWMRFGRKIYRKGLPPEREEVKRVVIRIGLGSLVTGFCGGLVVVLVNNPPVPTSAGQTTSIDWLVVLSCAFLWPMLVVALFFYSIFAPHRRNW